MIKFEICEKDKDKNWKSRRYVLWVGDLKYHLSRTEALSLRHQINKYKLKESK